MNTREREVMHALAKALCETIAEDVSRGFAVTTCRRDALDAYYALLAEGSASSEGAEAVGEIYISRSDGGMDVQWSEDYNPSSGDRLYLRPQPAQGEHEQRSCEPAAWLNVIGELSDTKRNSDDEAVGVRAAALIRGLEKRSCEGSERRPMADEVVKGACAAYSAAGWDGTNPTPKRMRAALEWYESALPRGLPAGSDALLTPIERSVIERLLDVCMHAFNLMDDTEDDGSGKLLVPRDSFDVLSKAMDALDDLPDDRPGYAMNEPAKAGWALRRPRCGAELTADQPSCGQDARDAFQARVKPWMLECFGEEISNDVRERGDRLLEEVLELLQSHGYDPARIATLRDYVYGRPAGEPSQEVGGVMVTLAAYCLATNVDMHEAGEVELARIWTKVEAIRAKQASKRGMHTPLPVPPATAEQPSCGQDDRLDREEYDRLRANTNAAIAAQQRQGEQK